MTVNPYSSPASDVRVTIPDARKPVSWWIMQIIMVPAAPLLLIYGAFAALYAHENTPRGDGNAGIVVFAIMCALSLWALAIAMTAYRRMPVVRWLGGAFIAVMILSGVSTVVSNFGSSTASTAYKAGQFVGAGMVLGLECFWLYAFAFSPKARHYLGLDSPIRH